MILKPSSSEWSRKESICQRGVVLDKVFNLPPSTWVVAPFLILSVEPRPHQLVDRMIELASVAHELFKEIINEDDAPSKLFNDRFPALVDCRVGSLRYKRIPVSRAYPAKSVDRLV